MEAATKACRELAKELTCNSEFKNPFEGCTPQQHLLLAKSAYWEAHVMRPTRAEALYNLTRLHREQAENVRAFELAQIGKKIAFPASDGLFLDGAVYDYLFDYELSIVASYVENHKHVGRAALEKLLARSDLPDWLHDICEHNAQFYI